jgi:hypothetical protein
MDALKENKRLQKYVRTLEREFVSLARITGRRMRTIDEENRKLRAQVEALRAALTEISEMGEGYATAMVITADKALDALREGE